MIFIHPPRNPGDPPPAPFGTVVTYSFLFGVAVLGVLLGLAAFQELVRP